MDNGFIRLIGEDTTNSGQKPGKTGAGGNVRPGKNAGRVNSQITIEKYRKALHLLSGILSGKVDDIKDTEIMVLENVLTSLFEILRLMTSPQFRANNGVGNAVEAILKTELGGERTAEHGDVSARADIYVAGQPVSLKFINDKSDSFKFESIINTIKGFFASNQSMASKYPNIYKYIQIEDAIRKKIKKMLPLEDWEKEIADKSFLDMIKDTITIKKKKSDIDRRLVKSTVEQLGKYENRKVALLSAFDEMAGQILSDPSSGSTRERIESVIGLIQKKEYQSLVPWVLCVILPSVDGESFVKSLNRLPSKYVGGNVIRQSTALIGNAKGSFSSSDPVDLSKKIGDLSAKISSAGPSVWFAILASAAVNARKFGGSLKSTFQDAKSKILGTLESISENFIAEDDIGDQGASTRVGGSSVLSDFETAGKAFDELKHLLIELSKELKYWVFFRYRNVNSPADIIRSAFTIYVLDQRDISAFFENIFRAGNIHGKAISVSFSSLDDALEMTGRANHKITVDFAPMFSAGFRPQTEAQIKIEPIIKYKAAGMIGVTKFQSIPEKMMIISRELQAGINKNNFELISMAMKHLDTMVNVFVTSLSTTINMVIYFIRSVVVSINSMKIKDDIKGSFKRRIDSLLKTASGVIDQIDLKDDDDDNEAGSNEAKECVDDAPRYAFFGRDKTDALDLMLEKFPNLSAPVSNIGSAIKGFFSGGLMEKIKSFIFSIFKRPQKIIDDMNEANSIFEYLKKSKDLPERTVVENINKLLYKLEGLVQNLKRTVSFFMSLKTESDERWDKDIRPLIYESSIIFESHIGEKDIYRVSASHLVEEKTKSEIVRLALKKTWKKVRI